MSGWFGRDPHPFRSTDWTGRLLRGADKVAGFSNTLNAKTASTDSISALVDRHCFHRGQVSLISRRLTGQMQANRVEGNAHRSS